MKKLAAVLILLLAVLACSLPIQHPLEIQSGLDVSTPTQEMPQPDAESIPPVQTSGEVVNPDDFEYLGAFLLPGGEDRPQTFAYGGNAMTFNPDGDSLFIMGHDRMPYGDLPDGNQVAEVSIPEPVISKNIEDLNTAEFIQNFANVLAGQFNEYDEIPKAGMQYLNRPETGARIHIAFGEHLQSEQIPTHGWFSPTLSNPNFQGTWFVGNQDLYSVNGYMFEIPAEWADAYVGGRPLATGRMRDGGQGGMGPSLFAYRPWNEDGSPPAGTRLEEVTLLLYENAYNTEEIVRSLNGYQHPDEWGGGAWLTTASGKAAVLFAGTKSNGEKYWYGYINPNGANLACVDAEVTDFPTCRMADDSVCPQEDFSGCCDAAAGECVSNRGWWTTRFDAEFILYDPADLAKVAAGQLESWQPQPYAVIDIDEHLYLNPPEWDLVEVGWGDQRRSRIGDVAFDRQTGLLYVLELYGDGVKPLVHVWKIR
jgi:hypothetical protein